jgi:protein AbiQ
MTSHIIKIENGRFGIINLSNMVPVINELLIEFDINKERNKAVLMAQFVFIRKNSVFIKQKATKVYENRILRPTKFTRKTICNYKKLETALLDYCISKNILRA